MTRFTKDAFRRADSEEIKRLCEELGAELQEHIAASDSFHRSIGQAVTELRELGHDLWNYDESDDFEVWGPSYEDPSGPGIVITFSIDGGVQVEWSEG